MANNMKEKEGCPHSSRKSEGNPSCGFAAHINGTSVTSHFPFAHDARLSNERVISSIPKSEDTIPLPHQGKDSANWEYPSEEMYFKAMKRKGWDPEAEQMKTIVAIHNSVNEQSWNHVLQWEARHSCVSGPKLKRFMGKPTEYSPKARLMNLFGWSILPFDRHDWIIDRDGKEVRYVIDFYSGQPEPGRPLSVYLDVRPALDSVESVLDRLKWQFEEKIQPYLPFRGLFGQLSSSSQENSPNSNEKDQKIPPIR